MIGLVETAWNNFYSYFGWGICIAPVRRLGADLKDALEAETSAHIFPQVR
jgi:hypothetical protein